MNYRKIKGHSLFNNQYIFVDTDRLLSSHIIGSRHIRARAKKIYRNEDNGLRLIVMNVRKTDETKFMDAMEQLKNSALLTGANGYLDMCEKLQAM